MTGANCYPTELIRNHLEIGLDSKKCYKSSIGFYHVNLKLKKLKKYSLKIFSKILKR